MNTDSDCAATRRVKEIREIRRISRETMTALMTTTIAVDTQEGTPGIMLPVLRWSLSHCQIRSHRSSSL